MIKLPVVAVKLGCLRFRSTETLSHTRGLRMESSGDGGEKAYAHYDHTDACKYSRWTARESYQFMYTKPWHYVVDFYGHLVNGRASIASLFPATAKNEPRKEYDVEIPPALGDEKRKPSCGRWARVTYKMLVAYHGTSFDGWQKQPNLNTVQGLVEKSLGNFVDERKAQLLKAKGLPLEGCCVVAGRTDKGVTALQQVCAFSTWRTDVSDREIVDSVNNAAPGKFRLLSISQVSRIFHPNFSAKWRRYLYMLPYSDKEELTDRKGSHSGVDENISVNRICQELQFEQTVPLGEDITDNYELEKTKPTKFSVSRVDQLLRKLEGKMLSYRMFARDTKASRNIGPPTECFVYHARATETRLPFMEKDLGEDIKVMCVELVANRFLRKMVRVLVATSIREAAAGAEDDALLKLMDATCRRATAPPAPPEGLCLVDVGYSEFEPQLCFIS